MVYTIILYNAIFLFHKISEIVLIYLELDCAIQWRIHIAPG